MVQYIIRHQAILNEIKSRHYFKIVDMGCGDGKLINYLKTQEQCYQIIGIDHSEKKIRKAKKLNSNENIVFINQSFLKYNPRFLEVEVIVLSEVIEHLHKEELLSLFYLIFTKYKPSLIVLTTPNKSYNKNYNILYNGLRHSSHLFELSDEDIPEFIIYLKSNFSNYNFFHKYCDSDGCTHLIIAERSEKT